jgi:integrase
MPLKLYQRGGMWHYRGTVGPKERRRRLRGTCGTSDQDTAARQIAEIEARYWKGHFDGPQSILTFARAAILYRNAGKSERFLKRVENYFGSMLVKDITAATIKQMAMTLYPNCSGASRNRQAIVPAQAVINFAAESELCPPIKVKRFKVVSKIKEPATLEWVKAMQEHGSPAIGALALFMLLTGARVGEAVALQWDDVDMKARTAIIKESKVSTERLAHLPDILIAALANVPKIKGRGVFVYNHPDDIVRAWRAPIKAAGIKRLTPHSCRHGFATGLLRRGVDVVTVAKLGGWKTPAQVLKTYGHAIDNRKLTDLLVGPELTHAATSVAELLVKQS